MSIIPAILLARSLGSMFTVAVLESNVTNKILNP